MSWRDDLTAALARLDALEAAELDMLRGKQVRQVSFGSELTEWRDGASLADLRAAITETRAAISRLRGVAAPRRAMVPVFRG